MNKQQILNIMDHMKSNHNEGVSEDFKFAVTQCQELIRHLNQSEILEYYINRSQELEKAIKWYLAYCRLCTKEDASLKCADKVNVAFLRLQKLVK